MTPKPVRLNI